MHKGLKQNQLMIKYVPVTPAMPKLYLSSTIHPNARTNHSSIPSLDVLTLSLSMDRAMIVEHNIAQACIITPRNKKTLPRQDLQLNKKSMDGERLLRNVRVLCPFGQLKSITNNIWKRVDGLIVHRVLRRDVRIPFDAMDRRFFGWNGGGMSNGRL